MADTKVFDHVKHHRLLDEAERHLAGSGEHELAAAVRQARSICIDFTGRIAEARRIHKRLGKVAEQIEQHRRTMGEYVTQGRGPWIDTDLFGKDFPDGISE